MIHGFETQEKFDAWAADRVRRLKGVGLDCALVHHSEVIALRCVPAVMEVIIDRLVPAIERFVRIELLLAMDDRSWTTAFVDVPAHVTGSDADITAWATENLSTRPDFRNVVMFAVYWRPGPETALENVRRRRVRKENL